MVEEFLYFALSKRGRCHPRNFCLLHQIVFRLNPLAPLGLNFFRGPQLRAAAPRIAFDFLLCGCYWLFRQYLQPTFFFSQLHRIFHDAVFQTVEADHHQPSAIFQDGRRCGCFSVYQRRDLVQLMVHEYAERLKSERRWMDARVFHCAGSGRNHFG